MQFYNQRRPQNRLNKLPPVEYRKQLRAYIFLVSIK
ncbi:hypothetical protein [Paenibacillus apii]